jgi:predicted PolB exonuclease-like 3'-5' exonuclease
MKTIVIDIETYKTTNPAHMAYLVSNVKASGTLKDPDKIAADIAAKQTEVVGKTSFDGAFGSIICIGAYMPDSDEFICQYNSGDDEKLVLENFMAFIDGMIEGQGSPIIVGHNVTWDWRFIVHRCIVNGVRISNGFPKRDRSDHLIDTMTAWAGYRDTISLDKLCVALDIPTPKDEMDGSKVGAAYEAGDHAGIMKYNKLDCIATAAVYKKMQLCNLI